MQLVAIARDRVVEGNGANPLAPSCGHGSGNLINNSRGRGARPSGFICKVLKNG